MGSQISPRNIRLALLARQEIALLDLREEASFAIAHPLFAAQLSLSRLELEIFDRVPRRNCPIVLLDAAEGLVDRGAARLADLGYSNVAVMEGGIEGWRAAGYELFQDVNSYSKAFGELVEARRHTPSISAEELQSWIAQKFDMVILDARRFDEYTTMNVPTSISVPGAELVLRASALAEEPTKAIVVNCAGRTRSIIGAQSLINAGLPNHVVALRNGTIGWTLAGLTLTHGQTRRGPDVQGEALALAKARARAVSYRAGVRHLTFEELSVLMENDQRTCYRFDVRSPEEYAAGHIPGFRSAPGGQLVQETDVYAPVRHARIVLTDDLGPRAEMTASWLAQMGWEVYVLEGGYGGLFELGAWRPTHPPIPETEEISIEALARQTPETALLIDLADSWTYAKQHIPGAKFAIRAQLTADSIKGAKVVVFTSPDGVLARFACADFQDVGPVFSLAGGTAAWIAAGLPLERGMRQAMTSTADLYKRPYEGTDNQKIAMKAYLDWEFGLVAQLERDATHGFFVI